MNERGRRGDPRQTSAPPPVNRPLCVHLPTNLMVGRPGRANVSLRCRVVLVEANRRPFTQAGRTGLGLPYRGLHAQLVATETANSSLSLRRGGSGESDAHSRESSGSAKSGLSRLGRPMKVVVTNLKGGVGKTTTAVYLAAAAASRGLTPVVVVDADRQASAAEWLEERPITGVEVVEAPSERTLTRAMTVKDGTVVVDLPPGDERLVQAAITAADAVVIPTRAGGVEFARVAITLEMIPPKTPRGIVVTAARLGTNDLQETIDWWKARERLDLGRRSGARRHRRRTRSAALPGRPW